MSKEVRLRDRIQKILKGNGKTRVLPLGIPKGAVGEPGDGSAFNDIPRYAYDGYRYPDGGGYNVTVPAERKTS